MSNGAVFNQSSKSKEAVEPPGPTASALSGERPALGGPRGSVATGCVMGSNLRPPAKAKRSNLSKLREIAGLFLSVREELGLTQEQMAEAVRCETVRCDAKTWARWERAEHEPGATAYLRVIALRDAHRAKRRTG